MCLFVFESVHSCENKRIEMENKSEIIDTPTATICRMVVLPLPREMEGTYAILMRLRAHHFTKLSHSLCGGALYTILELNVVKT